MALKKEWEAEDEAHQFRIKGGYSKLMDYLRNEVNRTGGTILLSHPVKQIKWKRNETEVVTIHNKSYRARQVLVTIPLGVLQAPEGTEGTITFSPSLPKKFAALQKMGFGAAIKIHIQCFSNFWEEKGLQQPMKKASFIFSNAFIPTWWTQYPNKNGLLTGWLAGPQASNLQNEADELIYEKAVESLCYIFSLEKSTLLHKIRAYKIHNWAAWPFSCGAYSFATLHTAEAIKVLGQPEGDTIYFAGEALLTGPMTGTVEAALNSGIDTARRIITST
jgi:monoamine oxidase